MIVSVIGTQCIGKSTFINDFIVQNKQFVLPSMDYRKIIEKNNLQLNRNGNYRSQRCLFDFMRDQLIELSKQSDKFYVVDRSLIDVVAYSMWLYDNKPDVFSEDQLCQMITELLEYVNLYSYLIYIPLSMCDNVKVVDDKFRDTDEQYRKQIDENFNFLLNQYVKNLPKIIPIFGNREQRIDIVKNKIPEVI